MAAKKIELIASKKALEWLSDYIQLLTPNVPRYALISPENKWCKPDKRDYLSRTIEGLILTYYNRQPDYEAVKPRDKGRYIDKSRVDIDVVGRARTIKEGVYVKQKDVIPGMADVMVTRFMPDGLRKVMWIEVKVGKDNQSPEQVMFQKLCERRGELYLIVKTIDDFLDFIKWPKMINTN
jgi:hypothetical protein